jgi:hypothetical protein
MAKSLTKRFVDHRGSSLASERVATLALEQLRLAQKIRELPNNSSIIS